MPSCDCIGFSVHGKVFKLSPPTSQYSFSPTLKQLIELQLELLSLWFFRISPWTVHIDYSYCFFFVLISECKQSKRHRETSTHTFKSGVLLKCLIFITQIWLLVKIARYILVYRTFSTILGMACDLRDAEHVSSRNLQEE